MSETIILDAATRTSVGTRASRVLRTQGRLPAVVYGHGEAVEAISLARRDVELALTHGVHTIKVKIGAKQEQCLIRDIQYDYLGTTPVHMDLTRVDVNERVRVKVGIELRGTPKGTGHGGILDQHLAIIEVECLVSAIPESLHPIVTELEVGQSLYVKDLDFPEGVKPLLDGDERVVTVHAPVDAEETAEGDETEASSTEPERIGRVRKDDEEQKSS